VSGLRPFMAGGGVQPFIWKPSSVFVSIGTDPLVNLAALVSMLVLDPVGEVRFCVTAAKVTAVGGASPVVLTFAPEVPSQAQTEAAGPSSQYASCPIPSDLWILPGETIAIATRLDSTTAIGSISVPVILGLRPA